MRFATAMESLGVSLISAVLTLLAFLPVLVRPSNNVTELARSSPWGSGSPIVCQFAWTAPGLRPSPVPSDTSIALLAAVRRADVRFPNAD
jgi:hypothetical protein